MGNSVLLPVALKSILTVNWVVTALLAANLARWPETGKWEPTSPGDPQVPAWRVAARRAAPTFSSISSNVVLQGYMTSSFQLLRSENILKEND